MPRSERYQCQALWNGEGREYVYIFFVIVWYTGNWPVHEVEIEVLETKI